MKIAYQLIRRLLFQLEPERAHGVAFSMGRLLQELRFPLFLLRALSGSSSPSLHLQLFGQEFLNPVGIAAGLDKYGELVELVQALGFGFTEIGSVTAQGTAGNPKPRLFRLEQDNAIINRMGLNNPGPEGVMRNLAKQQRLFPVGINVAKTNNNTILGERAVEDMVDGFAKVAQTASFVVLNVSCPNTEDGRTFEEPESLRELLSAIFQKRQELRLSVPVLVKFSADTSEADFLRLLDVAEAFDTAGYALVNTTRVRDHLRTPPDVLARIGAGGLSGRPLFARALQRVRICANHLEHRKTIIGCGGIDDPESAYAMIRAGASLIEIYTGLIYQGPFLACRIQKGLETFLRRDGFSKLSEAIGVEQK